MSKTVLLEPSLTAGRGNDRAMMHARCGQEQVHLIGRIQSHGLLFALSEPDLIVRHVSANVSGELGLHPADVLGRSIEAVLGIPQCEAFQSQLLKGTPIAVIPMCLAAGSRSCEALCAAHRQQDLLIVELELQKGTHSLGRLDIDTHIRFPLARLEAASDILELARIAALETRRLSGFHRVMVYRFDQEWNGEVIAEAMGPSPVSYYGLHFPASDIPPQARRLFLLNTLRTIADVGSAPVPVVSDKESPAGSSLDLTHSILRSTSPVHIEYLRNMDVRASMTISIIVDDRLWGMIACHHPTPYRVDHSTRTVCELLARQVASQVALRTENARLQSRLKARKMRDELMGSLEPAKSLADREHFHNPLLLELFGADGLVSRIDGVTRLWGTSIDEEALTPIVGALRKASSRGIASSSMLGRLDPSASLDAAQVSGALYVGLTEEVGDYVLFVRRELLKIINWAGNPNDSVRLDDQDRLHPRTSFAKWQETVRGQSLPWTELELESALVLREQLLRVTQRQQAQVRLQDAQARLLETSRKAGMAEVAAGVLHNLGNVLNSVNVSASLLSEQIGKSPVDDVARAVALLREQGPNLGAFFAADPRGPKVVEFLSHLAGEFKRVRELSLKEAAVLQKNIEHIKSIVAMQQIYGRVSGVLEEVNVANVIEDALAMQDAAFRRDEIEIERQVDHGIPPVTIEKHKVLQILVNLLRNAEYACTHSGRAAKRVTVRALHEPGRVRIQVADNGMGIQPENLNRIFNLGFTTKKDGHGYGLHSGANTAKEMGGSLTVHSDGPGCGAVFTLELPVETGAKETKLSWQMQ